MTRRLPSACAVALSLLCATSASAAIPNGPASRDAYDVWTIGDSYASGEGSPDVDGVYNDDGDVIDGQFEDWDTRFDGSPAIPGPNQDSTRCHRSGHTSTSAIATKALRDEFPDVNVAWTSVACGGASIVETGKFKPLSPPVNKGGILRGYDGADTLKRRGIDSDDLSPAVYPNQLKQINDAFSGRVDALLMNLGGNDAGFAELITQCMNIVPTGDCHTNQDLNAFVDTKLGVLNGRFNRLAASLLGTAQAGSGDPALRFAPRAVFLTAGPNPLRPSADAFCDKAPKGNYEENLLAVESAWLDSEVVDPLNARFATEAGQHGWHLVDSFVDQFIGHALCSPAPANWVNTNLQALRKQGELDETEGLPVAVSGGIGHPTRDGFAAIGAALKDSMRPVLVDHYTPDAAPATTTLGLAAGFSVTTSDAALPALTSGYWHRVRIRQLNSDGTVSNLAGADGLRDVPYGTTKSNYTRTGRYFAVARACGPLSRTGAIGCGPASAELPVSTFIPAKPEQLTAIGKAPKGLSFPSPGITVSWKHKDQFSRHDTRNTVVRLVRGRQVIVKNVPGPFSSTRVTGLTQGGSYSITVKACNDGNRCAATLGPVTATADQGESPASHISDIERIETVLEGVPCTDDPVPFDPTLGPGTPGVEDSSPSFLPACLQEPSVGQLRLARRSVRVRRGRVAKLELRWFHPGQWRSLHEVTVQLTGRRGTLATLRFDQDRERITLAPGTRRRGRSVKVGRTGVLKARGVRVRLRSNALEGSGPAGRDIRLRFGVVLPRSAGRRVGLLIGASDDTGQTQGPVAAGEIRVR